MPTHRLHSVTNAVEDLTSHEVGDLSLWIGKRKVYHNVPNYVANELCWRTSPLPSLLELLPSPSLPVLQLLGFPTPWITSAILVTTPNTLFSFHEPTHVLHQENPLFAFWCFFYFFHAFHEKCRKSTKKHKKAKSSTCQSAFQGSQKSILLSKVF